MSNSVKNGKRKAGLFSVMTHVSNIECEIKRTTSSVIEEKSIIIIKLGN